MTPADFQLCCGVLPEPMLLASADGVILAANEAAAVLLNRSVAEVAGLSLSNLSSDPGETIVRMLSRFARSGQLVPAGLNLQTSGGELPCRVEGARLRGEQALILLRLQPQEQAVGRFRLLSERIAELNRQIFNRTQAAVSSALLSAIIDSSDDAIISKNLDGVIMSWNNSAQRLFGYTADEAIGRTVAELLIPDDRQDEEPNILARLRRGERVDHFETKRRRKDGQLLDISLTISPVRDENGNIIGASKIARDVTTRVRHEQALLAAHEGLKRANADLQQFAYSASHDLQEPLRMVATYSELLKRRYGGKLGEDADECIRFTVEGAARMESLLRNLRIYTQVSIAEDSPPVAIDANEILTKTLGSLELAIRENSAVITTDVLPRVPMHEFQLQQLFQNLISNALRYRNSQPPRIHVSAKGGKEEWLFSVRDNGIGIESKFREQIFGIFKRLHSNSEYPGTGMGLAICQRIVERAGGRIWVESEPGCGSTFYFTIPASACSQSRPGALLDSFNRGQPGGCRVGA